MSKMNLPNKLTVMRLIMVPFFVVVMLLPYRTETGFVVTSLISVLLFIVASLTDMLDGKIARSRNLITDFGKFLDPLADKFMVIGALCCILYRYGNVRLLFTIATLIVVFRELAVTSIRLVASTTAGIVVPAHKLGKIKTVMQIVSICVTFIEPLIYLGISKIGSNAGADWMIWLQKWVPLTYVTTILMAVLTIVSGIHYMRAYWKYLDPQK